VGSLEALRVPAVANIFSPRYGGHYVAVLEIAPAYVIIGDPLSGRSKWSREEFLAQWSGAAHVFSAAAAQR
jgi:ABC-type bacteriocin/lantibiotic exporter with double-glycine peptidase domain